jgi:serine/threonine protein kinase
MGEVFLADDHQLGRKVAIKFLGEALDADRTTRERLLREARSAAALDHPYICKIFEVADVDGRTGIVMEHVTGETAQARLRRGPLAPSEALVIASEIAEALEEAHKRRVVHRDLKPSNVMLTEQGHVKVMDFGLAKQTRSSIDEAETIGPLTASGVRIGTPAYMAPEQILGGEADERSDIFAFGILLYELLAGVHPFTRSSQTGTLSAILGEAPPPVSQYAKDAPETARVVLDRLLAKEPQHRYQSFGEVRTDLGRLLQDATRWTSAPQPAPTTETASARRTQYVGASPSNGRRHRGGGRRAQGRRPGTLRDGSQTGARATP